MERIPVRPGEKKNETLITVEEANYVSNIITAHIFYCLLPTTSERKSERADLHPYVSNEAHQLTREELMELLEE